VLKMISLYVSALLCTLQHIVIHAMQLSGVNSPNSIHDARSEKHKFSFSFVALKTPLCLYM